MKMRSTLLLLAGCASLSACGFSPLYGDRAKTETAIQQTGGFEDIEIDNIPDREGQYLRNALIDRFYQSGRPANARYLLKVETIDESLTDLGITKSSSATRAQLRLRTTMQLIDRQKTEQPALVRELTAVTSYNVLQSQFNTRISEQDARESALDSLARQIETQLGLYFKRSPN